MVFSKQLLVPLWKLVAAGGGRGRRGGGVGKVGKQNNEPMYPDAVHTEAGPATHLSR